MASDNSTVKNSPSETKGMQPDRSRAPVGNWESWYRGLDEPKRYADTTTYRIAAEFLSEVSLVEDWGCGGGGFREFCPVAYRGIDGTKNKFVDEVVDLCTYRSSADGILMRHILEHNYRWREVLRGALNSFKNKMCLVLFTPFANETTQINFSEEIKVPDLSLSKEAIEGILSECSLTWSLRENIPTDSQYGIEHVYFIERGQK
jgi:hypothetical protein